VAGVVVGVDSEFGHGGLLAAKRAARKGFTRARALGGHGSAQSSRNTSEMRDFSQTAEPSGKDAKVVPSNRRRFVIQKHAATRLHFDLRLEHEACSRAGR
jgi:hypothetical protein